MQVDEAKRLRELERETLEQAVYRRIPKGFDLSSFSDPKLYERYGDLDLYVLEHQRDTKKLQTVSQ